MAARIDALRAFADRDGITLRSAERQHGPAGWVVVFARSGCPFASS